MREIKFRFWLIKSKKIVDDLSAVYEDGSINYFFKDKTTKTQVFNGKGYTEKFIPMQHTGLKDRNGVDIYEGDIIKCGKGGDKVASVYYDEFLASIKLNPHHSTLISKEIAKKFLEVIGNIYENPELLDAQKKSILS